jgi:hypothetical protein
VAECQAPVEKGLHLSRNVEKIDGRGEDDPVSGEQAFDDAGVVVLDPAAAFFHANPSADAVIDVKFAEVDDLK